MPDQFNPYDPVDERRQRYDEIMELVHAGLSYSKIGERFGISRARVGQIVKAGPPGLAGWAGKAAAERPSSS